MKKILLALVVAAGLLGARSADAGTTTCEKQKTKCETSFNTCDTKRDQQVATERKKIEECSDKLNDCKHEVAEKVEDLKHKQEICKSNCPKEDEVCTAKCNKPLKKFDAEAAQTKCSDKKQECADRHADKLKALQTKCEDKQQTCVTQVKNCKLDAKQAQKEMVEQETVVEQKAAPAEQQTMVEQETVTVK